MFGIVADLLAAVATVLFPVFASYKALQTRDVTNLAPWLMYWVVYSAITLVESWTLFILSWFPFYSWIRLFALSYLVLPQTQGAKRLYLEHVEPFLRHHEREIEDFIGQAHSRGSAMGLQYLKKLIDLIRTKAMGLQPLWEGQGQGQPETNVAAPSYAQALFSRFSLPAVGAGPAPGASGGAAGGYGAPDFVSMLGSVLGGAAGAGGAAKSPDAQAAELSASGRLLPRHVASAPRSEQAAYIASQRDHLKVLLSAYEREFGSLSSAAGVGAGGPDEAVGGFESSGLRKNRSDNSFENIEHEDLGASSAFDTHRYPDHRRPRMGDFE
ncbi:receptor expression-enhancing protein 3 [Nannizzia gypsea CBS 118893]|uniref:Protein YOP1 n=1 Tax=Arthroderma gypseum (strain ATCC MYA-4604 / CBS 118893) TaxID=535722 RepID=E4V528_ARTGP|nr:receptor expression-enhancing protein 3 [Nannizzia gypsea CBS 118893]EFR05102.1 receptor expression-enhancing protein 3 [Nannizzia gypsea CBS 118893]